VSSTSDTTLAAADRLEKAFRTGTPTSPVRDILGTTDVPAAYAVQDELNLRRTSSGALVVGRKIGLTSPAVQKQLGVDQPDFGVLFDDMGYFGGDAIPISSLIQPKAEAEVAFVLGKDLTGDLSLATARDAVEYAVAALEIVDSRVADWDITIVDTVADNGSSALYVLGPRHVRLDEFEPKEVEMSMAVDGEIVSTGNGAACLGDPLEALLWLARTAQQYGDPLRAGHVVLSGALGPMVPVNAGNRVRADITGLGSVAVNFTDKEIS
jgi:2-keto-4-pentenoate hydratase